nr:uncharacterized protein LOC105480740 [Macaca nemestrina]
MHRATAWAQGQPPELVASHRHSQPPHPHHSWPLAQGTLKGTGVEGAGPALEPQSAPRCRGSCGWLNLRNFLEEVESRLVCTSRSAALPRSLRDTLLWPAPTPSPLRQSPVSTPALLPMKLKPGSPQPASRPPLHLSSGTQGLADTPACPPLTDTSAVLLRAQQGPQDPAPILPLLLPTYLLYAYGFGTPCHKCQPPHLEPLPPHLEPVQEQTLIWTHCKGSASLFSPSINLQVEITKLTALSANLDSLLHLLHHSGLPVIPPGDLRDLFISQVS